MKKLHKVALVGLFDYTSRGTTLQEALEKSRSESEKITRFVGPKDNMRVSIIIAPHSKESNGTVRRLFNVGDRDFDLEMRSYRTGKIYHLQKHPSHNYWHGVCEGVKVQVSLKKVVGELRYWAE